MGPRFLKKEQRFCLGQQPKQDFSGCPCRRVLGFIFWLLQPEYAEPEAAEETERKSQKIKWIEPAWLLTLTRVRPFWQLHQELGEVASTIHFCFYSVFKQMKPQKSPLPRASFTLCHISTKMLNSNRYSSFRLAFCDCNNWSLSWFLMCFYWIWTARLPLDVLIIPCC